MQLLFIDYTNLVIKAYEEKRDADQLSRLLLQPTTAGIRQACLNVYNEKVRKGENIEENTLTDFFGVPPAGKKIAYHIENYPADRFRPIQTLMRRGVKNPTLINVELLAWIIDFTPRPFGHAQKVLESPDEQTIPIIPIPPVPPINPPTDIAQEPEPDKPGNNGGNIAEPPSSTNSVNNRGKKSRKKLKIAVSACLIAAALFGGGYSIWQHGRAGDIAYGDTNTGCMYWVDDHYEPVPCSEKGKGIIMPMDMEKMKNFKKIMRKDTMTEWSIGKAYYIKNNNIIEYYTTSGTHPIHVTDSLKVLSRYMFQKYLQKENVKP